MRGAGRWHAVSKSFAPARHISNAELRRRKAAALADAPIARGAAQETVWASVHELSERMGVRSPTRAHRDVFLARERELASLEPAFEVEPGQCGAVLGFGDKLSVDAVSRPDVFALLWPKLRVPARRLERLDGRPTETKRVLGFGDEAGARLP